MMQRFDIVCDLRLSHGYYRQAAFRDLRFVPGSLSAVLMKNNGFTLHQDYGRTQLTGPVEKEDTQVRFLHTVRTPFSLLFFAESANTYLDNISDFPECGPAQVPLFSNLFCSGDDTALNANVAVELCGNSWTLPAAGWKSTSFSDSFGNATEIPYRTENDVLFFDLSALEEDIYTTETDQGTRYISNIQMGFRARPAALLHICSNDSLWRNGLLRQPSYSLHIGAPAPYWRYLFPKSALEHYNGAQFSVEASDRSVLFDRDTDNGDTTYVSFTSAEPIPLEDRKSSRFRLKQNNGNGGQDSILVADLPLPDPSTLISRKDERMISPIFVKL